jgi:hypothetical protein
MRPSLRAALAALSCCLMYGASAAEAKRDDLFLSLVRERHVPPVTAEAWGRHVGDDCVWIGRGLRVVNRTEVQGLQIDTGKRVEIQDFTAHDYGDTAVLTYVVVEHQPQAGTLVGEATTRLRKMDTYLSRDGKWQLIANAEVVGKPDRKPVSLTSRQLDRWVGIYETVFNGKPLHTRVWREGSRLFAQTEGQEKGELLPSSPTEFFDAAEPEEDGAVNRFEGGVGGRQAEWVYRDGAVEVRSRRIQPGAE